MNHAAFGDSYRLERAARFVDRRIRQGKSRTATLYNAINRFHLDDTQAQILKAAF